MKKLIAILFLSGIFLGNLFAQETHLNTEKNNATIHAKSSKSSSSGHGKTIFFTEPTIESEDPDQKNYHELKFGHHQQIICENDYIKNKLSIISLNLKPSNKWKNSLPIFLVDLSIRI